MLAKIATVEKATLARQLANIDAMAADPLAKVADWQVGVVTSHPEALESRANTIMTGVERAAASWYQRYRARESGLILAGLLASLPRDRFVGFGPRILAVYAEAYGDHWLWDAEPLLRRLGDLGTDALTYLTNPRASRPNVNRAGVEGLCRVGLAGLVAAKPILLAIWTDPRGIDRDTLDALSVAMGRIGITPPPLPSYSRNRLSELQTLWADISPESSPQVCATRAERQARREERDTGERRTNHN